MIIDDSQLLKYESMLARASKRAIPRAVRQTINNAAFATRRESIKNIESKLTERNTFTRRSLRIDKATSLDIDRQSSEVGSIQRYMDKTEHGFTSRATLLGLPSIPTPQAAGLGYGQKRTSVVRRINRRDRMDGLNKSFRFASGAPRRRRVAAILNAASNGTFGRFFAIPIKNNQYAVMRIKGRLGKKRSTGKRRRKSIQASIMYILSGKPIVTQATPWLGPATDVVIKSMSSMYKKELIKQLQFLKRKGRL